MTSRERVLRTLEFAGPDRAPRDLWALPWVGMFMPEQQAGILNEFPSDFTWPGAVLAPGERRTGRESRKGSYTDDWGCVWECAEDGVISEVRHPPLDGWANTPADGVIAQMEWGPGVPIENPRAVYQAWQEPLEQLP